MSLHGDGFATLSAAQRRGTRDFNGVVVVVVVEVISTALHYRLQSVDSRYTRFGCLHKRCLVAYPVYTMKRT